MNEPPLEILLVEDSPTDAELTKIGFEEARLFNPLLPRLDGRQLLKEIKSDSGLRRIPVCVLTTSRAEVDVLKSYDARGAATALRKIKRVR